MSWLCAAPGASWPPCSAQLIESRSCALPPANFALHHLSWVLEPFPYTLPCLADFETPLQPLTLGLWPSLPLLPSGVHDLGGLIKSVLLRMMMHPVGPHSTLRLTKQLKQVGCLAGWLAGCLAA